MNDSETLIQIVLEHYPDTQAIYMFGTHGTEDEWEDSDVDIALLLPPVEAKQAGNLYVTNLHIKLEKQLRKDDQFKIGLYGLPKRNHCCRPQNLLRG